MSRYCKSLCVLALLLVTYPLHAQDADTLIAAADTIRTVDPEGDEALEAEIQAVFNNIEDFADLNVSVSGGVVRLTGTVSEGSAEDKAEELAAKFEGVIYVDSQIEQDTAVEARVSPAFRRVQAYLDDFVSYLPVAGVALLVFLLFAFLGSIVGRWEAPFRRLGVRPIVRNLVQRILKTLLIIVGLILALDILDITALVGAVLGTAGVVGLALGFAFQDIAQNYLSGALLSVRQPFVTGDIVQVGDHQGKVVQLTWRELILMTFEGNHLRLPNATVFQNPIVNYTRNPRRRFDFVVGVGVEENLVDAMDLGKKTLNAMRGVMEDPPPFAFVETLADSNVAVRFFAWVDQREADFLKVKSEAIRLVKTAMDDAGIEMPEPIYRVHLFPHDAIPTKKAQDRPTPDIHEEAQRIDVTVETSLDEQIQEDLAMNQEKNLLNE